MAGLNLEGFVTPEQPFSGLYKAGDTLERRKYRDAQLAEQKQGKRNAATTFLTSYLDKKDYLSGTNYDPKIVQDLQSAMNEGAKLAASGADTPTIMMALGPAVNKINEYSTKAKLIDQQIKGASTKLKQFKGYDTEALSDEARKLAFYDDKGQLKDISQVDPNQDWISEVTRLHPEKVTTGAGFDDFTAKTPMAETSKELQTMYAGKKRNVKYDAKAPFWMDVAKDDKGETALDVSGNPIGMDVMGSHLTDDKGQPMINPETKQPYKVVDKNVFNAIMQHNPDVADYVRGQVNTHFKQLGAKEIPSEGSPQWDMMARNIVYDELKTRDKSSFKTRDNQSTSAPVTRIELGYPAYGKGGSAQGNTAIQANEFDRIPDNIPMLEQKDGKILNKAGEENFTWEAGKTDLPSSLHAILKSAGYDISDYDKFDLEVKEGKIESIVPLEQNSGGTGFSKAQKITRQDMENAQLKYNTEPQKGQQLQFGQPSKKGQSKSTKKSDPLGLF